MIKPSELNLVGSPNASMIAALLAVLAEMISYQYMPGHLSFSPIRIGV
jgi:hypothetical protein